MWKVEAALFLSIWIPQNLTVVLLLYVEDTLSIISPHYFAEHYNFIYFLAYDELMIMHVIKYLAYMFKGKFREPWGQTMFYN